MARGSCVCVVELFSRGVQRPLGCLMLFYLSLKLFCDGVIHLLCVFPKIDPPLDFTLLLVNLSLCPTELVLQLADLRLRSFDLSLRITQLVLPFLQVCLEAPNLGHVLGLLPVASLFNGFRQGLDLLDSASCGRTLSSDAPSVKSTWVPPGVTASSPLETSLSPAAMGLLVMLAKSMASVDLIGLGWCGYFKSASCRW